MQSRRCSTGLQLSSARMQWDSPFPWQAPVGLPRCSFYVDGTTVSAAAAAARCWPQPQCNGGSIFNQLCQQQPDLRLAQPGPSRSRMRYRSVAAGVHGCMHGTAFALAVGTPRRPRSGLLRPHGLDAQGSCHRTCWPSQRAWRCGAGGCARRRLRLYWLLPTSEDRPRAGFGLGRMLTATTVMACACACTVAWGALQRALRHMQRRVAAAGGGEPVTAIPRHAFAILPASLFALHMPPEGFGQAGLLRLALCALPVLIACLGWHGFFPRRATTCTLLPFLFFPPLLPCRGPPRLTATNCCRVCNWLVVCPPAGVCTGLWSVHCTIMHGIGMCWHWAK